MNLITNITTVENTISLQNFLDVLIDKAIDLLQKDSFYVLA